MFKRIPVEGRVTANRTSIGFPSNPYNTHCQGAIFHICESSKFSRNGEPTEQEVLLNRKNFAKPKVPCDRFHLHFFRAFFLAQ